jgi:CHAD domain-containing protein
VNAKLKKHKPGTRGVQRIARSRIESALQCLSPKKKTTDRSIHSARKELKKARATLRLLRGALGDVSYKRENAALRDAARPLGKVRDGRVLLDALSSLVKYYGAPASALPLTGFQRALNRQRRQSRNEVLGTPGPLRVTRKALREARARSGRWHVGRGGWSVLGAGLQRTYGKARAAFRQARARPTDENLHEWRKQTKYFWHQLQVFEPLWPGQLGELADEAHKLADFLGDDHDLAVLGARAEQARETFPKQANHKALLGLIERCRAGLQEKAVQLGLRLYEEKPGVFAARMEQYWRDWRAA